MKIGDIVKITKTLKFSRTDYLKKGTRMVIAEYHNDGIYKCRKESNGKFGVTYCLLTHQIEEV